MRCPVRRHNFDDLSGALKIHPEALAVHVPDDLEPRRAVVRLELRTLQIHQAPGSKPLDVETIDFKRWTPAMVSEERF
jgi:hypothetical protein